MKIDIASGHAEGRSTYFLGHTCNNFLPVVLPKEDNPKDGVILDVTPGLTTIVNNGLGPVQGMCRVHELKYCIINDTVYLLNDVMTLLNIGTIASFGRQRCNMIPGGNNYILICAGPYGYVIDTTSNVVTQITDPDFPGADCGLYQDGYWCIVRDGVVYYSELQDPFAWSGTDVIETSSKPSYVKAIGSVQEELYLLGEQTIEIFYNDGTTPFSRRTFSTLAYGIASQDSLAHIDNSIIFLSRSFDGIVRVVQIMASQMYIISTESISWELAAAETLAGTYAVAYSERGHTLYALTVPDLEKTFVIDLTSKEWHIRQSCYTTDSQGVPIYEAWRPNCVLYVGSTIYLGDRKVGKIYKLDFDVLTEDGVAVRRILETKTFGEEARYITLSDVELDVETGLGGDLPRPQLALQISRDGGKTWSAEKWRSLGKTGEYSQYIIWHGLGRAKNWKFKFIYADSVPIKLGSLVAHGSTGSV